jgi:subtilisin family serine protease
VFLRLFKLLLTLEEGNMSFLTIPAKSLRSVCLFLLVSAFVWPRAYGQQVQVQSMDWMKKFAAETSAKALQKMPGKLRQLAYAPREFVQMQAHVIEIKDLETGDPTVGLLVKSTGGREELEALGAQVGAQISDIFSVHLPLSRLSALANLQNVVQIAPSLLCKPTLDKSIVEVKANLVHQGNYGTSPPTYSGFTGQNVLAGIIDTGIDWRHGDFIKDGTTASRIAYIWDQNLTPLSTERKPSGFAYGVEYTQQEINDELDGTPTNFVRERDTDGHGTHVAGTVAGDGSATGGGLPAYTYVGMAPRADIVAINTNFSFTGVVDGVAYMLRKSDELGKPAVVNMSLGTQFGPHDGTELICQAIDAAVNTGKLHAVISAGNEGTDTAHGEYIHAEGTVTAGTSITHEVVVPTYTPNSGAGNDFFEFNLWYQGNDRLTVQVTTPNGFTWSAVSGSDNNGTFSSTSDGAIYIDNASLGPDPGNGDLMCGILIFDYFSSSPPRSGTWRITVTGATVAESGHFDNWLDFSQVGIQSVYFSATSGNLEELIGIPGVAAQAITVGAYSTKTSWTDYLNRPQTVPGAVLDDLAYFSSTGPTRDDPGFITGRLKPEISAPGFGVVAALSANASGFLSSIYRNQDQVHLMLWGTSMSAPHITGAVALLLEKNPRLTAAEVKNVLMNTARQDGFTGGTPNYRWGAGKLDIQAAANSVTQPDLAFDLFPSSFSRYALPNTFAEYIATIRNQGTLADSYDLFASGNLWTITFFDASGATPITNTGTVQPGATVQFRFRVAVPNGTPVNQQDRATIRATSTGNASVSDTATVVTRTPGTIPFAETFASAILDSVRWVLNLGPAEANTAGIAEPSPPYSLNLNGDGNGSDEIYAQALNLAGLSGVQLEYFYQRTGGGESPESGDDLWVDYLNASGQWVNLKQYLGSGPDMTTFDKETITLPADAHHAFFQLRFRNLATAGLFDDWFIDDISLSLPPDITATPNSFAVTLDWGDTTTQTLQLGNVGQSDLTYSISISAASGSLFADLASSKINEVKHAAYLNNKRQRFGRDYTVQPQVEDPRYSDGVAPIAGEQSQSFEPAGLAISTLAPARVYWDYYHARDHALFTNVISELINAGHTVTEFNVPIAAAALTGFDVLVIEAPGSNGIGLSNAEIAAAQSFVNSGRGLFVIGEAASYLGTIGASSINLLLSPYGMSIAGSFSAGVTVPVTDLTAHPVTQNVHTAEFIYFCDITANAPSIRLARTSAGIGVVAAYEESGRIVLIADSNPFDNTRLYVDNLVLGLNIVDWLNAEGGVSWLKAAPTSGTVIPSGTANVTLSFDSRPVIPGRTYQADVNISSNDPDESLLALPAQMTVNPEPYFVVVDPASSQAEGYAKEVVAHPLRIHNYGQNNDSYTLRLAGNGWQTQIFDSTGTTLLASTPPIAAGGNFKILVKVTIDSLATNGSLDTVRVSATSLGNPAVSGSAKLTTVSRGLLGTIPFVETFPTTTLDPVKWPVNNGPAVVNTLGANEPSVPNSLNFNGTDEVQSQPFDLSGRSNLLMQYFYEMGGGGDIAESGNDLLVEYLDNAGNWQILQRHLGGGPAMTAYIFQEIFLPDSAYHNNFAFRFRTTGDINADDWFVDNLSINLPSPAAVSPMSFDVSVGTGDSTTRNLTITNQGAAGSLPVNFSIVALPGSFNNSPAKAAAPAYPENYYTTFLAKGENDPRRGNPVTLGAGGPDQFGYRWFDSDEPGGPAFNWVEISTTGTVISGLSDDINLGPFNIGFSFPFYGANFTTFRVCSNGFISFTSTSADNANDPLPNAAAPLNLIAPFWDDLVVDSPGAVYYRYDGQKLIIEYKDVRKFASSTRYTFEMFLFPNGDIVFQYLSMPTPTDQATVGIQNGTGTDGLEIAFNTSYVHNSLAVLITRGVSWLSFNPSSGTVAPNASQTVEVEFNARGIPPDTVLHANIFITTNATPKSFTIPATMRTTPLCTQPTHFTFRANTGNSYALVIDDATLDGVRLQRCDEIGVFTPAGLCVGAVAWNDTLPLGFAAWEDDPQTPALDGYIAGEKMYFRIWDDGVEKEYEASATYTIGDGNFGSGALARFTLGGLTEVTQTVSLRQGWNWMSFHIDPTKPNMDSVFAKVAGMDIVQNCAGRFYIPGVINQIGNLNALESYIAHLKQASSVTVRGQQLASNTPVILPAGWSCVSYLPQGQLSPQAALPSLITSLNIIKG